MTCPGEKEQQVKLIPISSFLESCGPSLTWIMSGNCFGFFHFVLNSGVESIKQQTTRIVDVHNYQPIHELCEEKSIEKLKIGKYDIKMTGNNSPQ